VDKTLMKEHIANAGQTDRQTTQLTLSKAAERDTAFLIKSVVTPHGNGPSKFNWVNGFT